MSKARKKKTTLKKIIKLWLTIFGAADKFHMDSGGEFANEEMRELGIRFGTRIKQTADYSSLSSCLDERIHAAVDLVKLKIFVDMPAVSKEVALQYAVAIRNCCMY